MKNRLWNVAPKFDHFLVSQSCAKISVPVANVKTEGPTTMLTHVLNSISLPVQIPADKVDALVPLIEVKNCALKELQLSCRSYYKGKWTVKR